MSRRVALVTGAASGIGRAIAIRLANDGFEMAICDLAHQKEALDTLAQEINHAHPGIHVSRIVGDVSVETEVEAMIAIVVEDHGSLDVMVANAGVLMLKPLIETSVEDWDRLFSVNARGVFLCYKHAGRQMISQGRGGRIIGASSVVGKQAAPLMSAYSSTKFAIRGLTQAAAAEFGPHGITVNAYAPGTINTPFLNHIPGNRSEFLEKDRQMTVTGTIGEPEDIAGLVSYLASSESKFMTGQTVSINGGRFFD